MTLTQLNEFVEFSEILFVKEYWNLQPLVKETETDSARNMDMGKWEDPSSDPKFMLR